ncbi:response regulator [Isoptericola jiangsuensis]|uniref:response regulator n=1 Tax=Isoptericola jiangsuensis TaxID=548579 RepID=UPI003AAD371B
MATVGVMNVVSVVLVDDDALVRAGLRLILGGASEVRVVADAADGAEAVEVVGRERPDVVLMDIRMPRVDGLEATRLLMALPDAPRVLVLTTFDTDDLVLQALRAGAAGFLLKDTPPERLVAAVLAAAAGEPTLSPSVMAQLMARVSAEVPDPVVRPGSAAQRVASLTDREREVAVVLARGSSNAEIAAELFMSVPTVKTHLSRILDKLGVANRVQAAIMVHESGLGAG